MHHSSAPTCAPPRPFALQIGQVVVFAMLGGLPFVVWGVIIRWLLGMHMTW
jgi:hypothetical protein